MRILKSSYYEHFRCIAGSCPDSCCKEWDVQVDKQAAALYRSLPGPLGDRLRQVLAEDPDAGTIMTIENGRCPMWQEDGLCRIQAELGEEALCRVCREFPRLKHDYGDFMELGLELSCPEAARLILTAPAAPFITEQIPGGEEPEYDAGIMSILLKTRETALALLNDHAYSASDALILLLFYGYQVQTLLDGGEELAFIPESILALARDLATVTDTSALLHFFSSLEILTEEWKNRLNTASQPLEWSDLFRNLARYGVERYWLQAVSDYDLVSRVKLIIVSCLLVKSLGGDVFATAQLYSKEIENDANNVDAILDAACTHPALTDDKLLWLLLS